MQSTLNATLEPIVVRSRGAQPIWLLRDHVTPLIGPEHTGGRFAVVVSRTHPGDGTPPHIHRNEDEAFFVLEGEMTFLCHDTLIHAPAGSFVWGPRNVLHCFRNSGDKPTTMLLMVTPAAFLEFGMALAEPAPDFASPPVLSDAKIGQLMEVAPRYGIEMRLDHALPTVIQPAAAPRKRVWAMGCDVSYLLTSEQTGGQFTVVDIRTGCGGGAPAHAHTVMDEMFYVVEGAYRFLLGDREQTLEAGDACFIPHGVRHRFNQVSPGSGRLIDLHTPGGFEAFFDEIGTPYEQHPTAPALPPLPDDALAALLGRHGMTV